MARKWGMVIVSPILERDEVRRIPLDRGTFREYSGNIQGTFRQHSGHIQGTFSPIVEREEVRRVPLLRSQYSIDPQGRSQYLSARGTQRPKRKRRSGLIQATFRQHSGDSQGTFREHSGNIQWVLYMDGEKISTPGGVDCNRTTPAKIYYYYYSYDCLYDCHYYHLL
jgi:hypothetical protein